jgi:hypothetical protein
MMRDDVAAAWRYFLFNWAVIALMSAAFALGLVLAGFTIELSDCRSRSVCRGLRRLRACQCARRHGAIRR